MRAPTMAWPAGREANFPRLLRHWRQFRRLSQLDLALASDVSQRHVSFLEAGRAKPSRKMILLLCETLDVPLRDRNDWLTAGGFAPAFQARDLDDPQMDQVLNAVRLMLKNHEPFPAVAVDRAWNIKLANAAFERLDRMIADDIWSRVGGEGRNLMRLFFHPGGLRPYVTNWSETAPLLWRRAQREAEAVGGEDMRAILAELGQHQETDMLRSAQAATLLPVMPLHLSRDRVGISVFTVISSFGTAQDITADELRIECMFPADDATEALFRAAANASTPPDPA